MNTLTEYMLLTIYVDNNSDMLKHMYKTSIDEHNSKAVKENYDAGFDLFVPDEIDFNNCSMMKVDTNLICSAKIINNVKGTVKNTSYYLYPRSSISKTPLRMANSVGIIDSGYRGHIIGMFDIINTLNDEKKIILKYSRLLQICAPSLSIPILVEMVEDIKDMDINTERGAGGFGSTGR